MTNLNALIEKLTSGDDRVAEASVEEIAALGENALPALFSLLGSKNPDDRWWALRVLAVIPHPEVPPRLQRALHDPNTAIRQCAALGLSEQPSEATIPDLIALLEDEDHLLARLAGDALIALGSQALPQLNQTLESGHPAAQIEAARALALIGDKKAIAALFAAWQGDSAMVQYWAEIGFEKMGVGMQFFAPNG